MEYRLDTLSDRRYEKAAEVFRKLSSTSNDSKYLYWKSRGLEANGKKDLKNLDSFRERQGLLPCYVIRPDQEGSEP